MARGWTDLRVGTIRGEHILAAAGVAQMKAQSAGSGNAARALAGHGGDVLDRAGTARPPA